MMKNRAGWLALTVLVIASLVMVFFVWPKISRDGKPIGETINAAGDAVKDAVTQGAAPKGDQVAKAPEAAKPAEPAAPTPAPVAPATQPAAQPAEQAAVVPSFDVLRVEPDGSTVIAGRAQPHATLEVTDGAATVAKTDVGGSGDFAAILDNPLPPGDHTLVLKATGKDGKVVMSEEVATVSVPVNDSTKLLAMVTKPGKASRVIATPAPATAAATVPAPAPAARRGAPAQPATETAAATPAAPAATPAPTMPELPKGSSDLASTAPNMGGTQAAAPAATATPATPTAPLAAALQITAVEIEGSKIFVAGTTKAGLTLRGQADGKPIGSAQAGTDGHFVIEGTIDLPVGDHRISVDAVNGSGQVLVRVEVPFNRPAGEQVAAVATPQAAISANDAMSAIDNGAFDKLRNDVVKAFRLLSGLYAGSNLPSVEQMTAARSATGIALRSLSEYRLPVDAAQAAHVIADATTKDAVVALSALDALPKDVAGVGAGLKQIADLIAKAVGPVIAQQLQANDAMAAAGTIQQAPLTQSARPSVIIRRGDTLWQISRRVYGQGVRYTTIYLANEDQIRNPDIIQPGQIFGVPDEARPDSEELHRERMMHKKG